MARRFSIRKRLVGVNFAEMIAAFLDCSGVKFRSAMVVTASVVVRTSITYSKPFGSRNSIALFWGLVSELSVPFPLVVARCCA